MEEKDLKKLRNQIDTIDDEILNLIVKRSSVVDQIGIIKNNEDHSLDLNHIVDKNRESKVIERLLNLHKGNFSKDSIVRIWREIFHTSANIQLKDNNKSVDKKYLIIIL